VAGVNGNVGAAGMALLKTISTAESLHDVTAQISFSTWLANGMTVNGMADKAISLLDRALSVVPKDPDAGFPVQLYIAKIRALVSLPANDQARGSAEAKQLIDVALKYARENNILGAQCELLNQAGLLAMEAHDTGNADEYFRQTVDVAKLANLPRMEAEGYLHLSEIYEQRHELNEALTVIDSGIRQMRVVEEGFDLPVYLARKSEIEADR
jgi:tetratricopeptide (TPR) repeat protein